MLLTLDDACELIGMAPRRLHEAIAKGELTTTTTDHGRPLVSLSDLARFLSAHSRRMSRQRSLEAVGGGRDDL